MLITLAYTADFVNIAKVQHTIGSVAFLKIRVTTIHQTDGLLFKYEASFITSHDKKGTPVTIVLTNSPRASAEP